MVLRGSCPGGNCPGRSCPRGVIALRGSRPRGSCPQGSCPRGSCPRGSCPRTHGRNDNHGLSVHRCSGEKDMHSTFIADVFLKSVQYTCLLGETSSGQGQ